MLRKNFGINDYKKCMEILFLLAIAFLTFSYFGGYYLIISTIGKYSKLLERTAYVICICKVLGTRYRKKEFFLLLGMGLLAIVTYRISGNKSMIYNVLVITGLKNVDFNKMLKVSMFSLLFTIVLVGICSVLGYGGPVEITQMYGREGIETRYCFGFIHPNQWAHAMFMLLLFCVMAYWDKLDWKKILLLFLGNCVIYKFSISKTSFLAGGILLLLAFLYCYLSTIMRSRIVKVLEIAGIAIVWWIPIVAVQNWEISWKIIELFNKIFTGRLLIAKKFYGHYKSYIWGVKLADKHPMTGEELDMGYMRFLLENGWVWYCLLAAATLILVIYSLKKQQEYVVVAIVCILLYAFSEAISFSQVPANIIFYYIGYFIFRRFQNGQQRIWGCD